LDFEANIRFLSGDFEFDACFIYIVLLQLHRNMDCVQMRPRLNQRFRRIKPAVEPVMSSKSPLLAVRGTAHNLLANFCEAIDEHEDRYEGGKH
jgi:hypothetical protein